ncbi:TonB-dependent receptor [Parvularcula sp. ZS-1/3]|uniref:TonB-dependent receptor n=1 Tax=Parvularcula mediterranea TaxID=2732508 RepID=A0A7Y3W448_9PROT|nr:TonB-dependent receptor [Parvularcula mediterranea]NNU15098.1 TonB-dependent receptor [Parvularcula mediterranea]
MTDTRWALKALLLSASLLALSPAAAETAGQDPQDDQRVEPSGEQDSDVIVVDAVRRRGVTLSTVEPELVLGEEEIAAYGVSSIAELLEELAPETTSGRTRRNSGGGPVVLLNGRRISGFREIGRYPPEALARVEVLPEEAALAYGFSADRRVINFILKDNVVVRAVESELETPDQGGSSSTEASLQRLKVDGNRRFSVDLRYERQSELLEKERDFTSEQPLLPFANPGNLGAASFGDPIGALIGADPSVTVAALQGASFASLLPGVTTPEDAQAFRALRPETEEIAAGFSRSGLFLFDSILTISGEFEAGETISKQGLGSAALDLPASNSFVPFADGVTLYAQQGEDGQLFQETTNEVFTGGLSVVSKLSPVNWTLTANYEVSDQEATTDLGFDLVALQAAVDAGADPFALLSGDIARVERITENRSETASAEGVVNWRPFELPAGDVRVSAQAGVFSRAIETEARQEGEVTVTDLDRQTFSTQINVDAPVTDRVDGGIGTLSVNGNLNFRELSDFGSLLTWGAGFNWRPNDKLRFLVSYTVEEGAPGIQQLGNPELVTPNVRVFDFVTGETVLVESISGGNPNLLADAREVSKIGVQIKPWEEKDVTFNIDYTESRIDDEARGFPALTAEVEAAFADRFVRDTDGTLLSIDRRPVNFEEGTQRQLRSSINWSKRLGRRGGRPGGRPGGPPSGARPGSRPGGPPAAAASGRPQGERPQGGPPAGSGRPSGQPPAASGRPSGPPQGGQAQGQRRGPPQGANAEGGRRQPNRQPTRSGRPGRMGITLTHTWVLEDELVIAAGLPTLDLLNGSAIGQNGGTAAHQLTASLRRWNKGLGVFSRVNWQSGSEVDGSLTGGSDLSFSQTLIADVRMGYDLGYSAAIMQRAPWLRNTRISVGVDNIFDSRIDVENPDGETPLRYQRDLIDPLGRVFELEIRKRF